MATTTNSISADGGQSIAGIDLNRIDRSRSYAAVAATAGVRADISRSYATVAATARVQIDRSRSYATVAATATNTSYSLGTTNITRPVLDLSSSTRVQAPAPAQAPNTFHPFPHLPAELRVKIWKMLIPASRKIFIVAVAPSWVKVLTAPGNDNTSFHPNGLWKPVPDRGELVPAILSVNYESRAEALKYLSVFECDTAAARTNGVRRPRLTGMYINYRQDWICIKNIEHFDTYFTEEQKARCALVVTDMDDLQIKERYEKGAGTAFPRFEGLRHLCFVDKLEEWLGRMLLRRTTRGIASHVMDLLKYSDVFPEEHRRSTQALEEFKRLREVWCEARERDGDKGELKLKAVMELGEFGFCDKGHGFEHIVARSAVEEEAKNVEEGKVGEDGGNTL